MRACNEMKQNKVYSTSDFRGVNVQVVVEDCYWTVDHVSATKAGQHSKLPLFEVQLKKLNFGQQESGLPSGFVDSSDDMMPNRTYYVREGRAMYNTLADIWKGLEGDVQLFTTAALNSFWKKIEKKCTQKVYKGHVVRLSGVNYTKLSRDKENVVSRNSLELWYPTGMEPEVIIDDFVRLCNRGVYTPILPEPAEKQDNPLEGIDPKIIAAVMAALGK